MGLFGSSKKTYVSTSVSRLIEDDQIPKPIQKALVEAVLKGNNVADAMLDTSLNSSVFKFERMYRYAASGDYFYGLPSARQIGEPAVIPVVQSVLETQLGQAVTVDYAKLDEALPKHYGYQTAFDSYGFNRATGELEVLSQQKGTPVYLKNMLSYVPVASEDDINFSILDVEEDILPTEYGHRTSAQQDQATYEALRDIRIVQTTKDFVYDLSEGAELRVEVFYVWDNNGVDAQSSFTVTLPDSTDADPKVFYQVGYHTAGNAYGYWTYRYGSGAHPTLDTFADVQYSREGTYFPFAIFRRQYTNRTLDQYADSEEFKTTSTLLDYIGVDFQEMGASIHESPDIDDVIQAAMMMAVPLNTSNQIEARYLFDYFDRLGSARSSNSITWSDADFSMTLSFDGITNRTEQHAFGAVGDYQVSVTEHSRTYTTEYKPGRDASTTTRTYTVNYKKYHIKKQLGAGLARVVTVINPVSKYDIDSSRSYESTEDNSILLVPLDYLITRGYKISERTELYHRSLHFVFNAKVVVKLKWYETSFFRFVMLVVAVVLMFIPGGQYFGTILATFSAGLTYLAIAMLLIYVSVMIAISYAFKLIVKELGVEAAFAIALVMFAYGGYQALSGNVPTAQNFMGLSTNLMDASTYVLEQDMKAITQENEELSALKTEKEKELDEAMKLLDTNDFLDPFSFIGLKPISIPGESPDDLYMRTVHIGNTADLSYKSIEHYVDLSLTLPGIK